LAHVFTVSHHSHRAAGDGAAWDAHAFGLLDDDFGGSAHPRLQSRRHLVELESDVVAHHAAAARGEDRHFADMGRQLAAFERFDGDRCDLADFDMADFRFAERDYEPHRGEVAEYGKGGARGSGGT
jgi:hypothetical protein